MKIDPITGPLSREEFAALIDAPYGRATEVIRKYDPMFGRAPGEQIEWEVTFERDVTQEGYAVVKASSEEEAREVAEGLSSFEIDWNDGDLCRGRVADVKAVPAPGRRTA
ncbi:MAG: hypothetical protein J0H17_15845 [Rhizobiales bacterium]|nr:hypothetical protein [Hyphomicrobiales bacterium]